MPTLRAQLTTEVLVHSTYVVALHAAVLVVDDRLLLITGPPGAGKTTLAVALLASAFGGFAADDFALLDADGLVRGIPFWPGLKEGSWPLLKDMRHDLGKYPVHRRRDGKRVRFVPPCRPISQSRREVGWVVALSAQPVGGRPGLVPLDQLQTLEVLLGGASSPDDRLSTEAFGALAQLIHNARCFSLSRLPLAEAVDAIRNGCV